MPEADGWGYRTEVARRWPDTWPAMMARHRLRAWYRKNARRDSRRPGNAIACAA